LQGCEFNTVVNRGEGCVRARAVVLRGIVETDLAHPRQCQSRFPRRPLIPPRAIVSSTSMTSAAFALW
jgi:hypothetical protein